MYSQIQLKSNCKPYYLCSIVTKQQNSQKDINTCSRSWAMSLIKRFRRASSSAWETEGREGTWKEIILSTQVLLEPNVRLTILNCALACCTRLSCSDWVMLVKMPTSGLKCRTLPWRFVKKCPKLRMQQTRTTHWGKEGKRLLLSHPSCGHISVLDGLNSKMILVYFRECKIGETVASIYTTSTGNWNVSTPLFLKVSPPLMSALIWKHLQQQLHHHHHSKSRPRDDAATFMLPHRDGVG